MINTNQDEKKHEELKLSPLGTDEINSVIKSFKNSTFNQEELYKKDKKNFVKKTLFDLAKESERTSSEVKQSEIDISTNNDIEKKIDESQEIVKQHDQKIDLDNTSSLKDLDKNNENNEKKVGDIDTSIDETLELDKVLEENIKSTNDKSEEVLEKNINQDLKDPEEKISEADQGELNETEYEEKTLEALDSVREAVTKSLEENSKTQNEEITNITDDSKIVSNDIASEINLINTLFKNIREISNDEIENIVKSKVIELAEDVIGYQIEKFPDKFLKKIKNSINEIKSINNDIKIYLNEHDFNLINKFIDKNKVEINFKLDLESSLGRGDFTIDMGGVVQTIKYKKVIE